jgi:hypothetical protein
MLTPIGTLQGLPLEQQLDLACRTLLAFLLTFRPDSPAPKVKREAFKMICDGVQVWLKDEITEMRRSQATSKKMTPKAKVRQRVGHA